MRTRADGPKVLVVTVPKSGTHLLDSILERMPPMKRREKVALNAKLRFHPFNDLPFTGAATCMTGIGRPCRVKASAMHHALGRIRPWRYAMAQLPIVMEFIARLGIRPIVVVRDPRDVLVSLMHHALTKPAHFMHRDTAALATGPGAPVGADRRRAERPGTEAREHRRAPRVHPRLGGGPGGAHAAVRGSRRQPRRRERRAPAPVDPRARRLDRTIREREAEEIGQTTFGAGRTFRKGQIGGWREVFDEALREEFERLVGDRMKRMRYTHE